MLCLCLPLGYDRQSFPHWCHWTDGQPPPYVSALLSVLLWVSLVQPRWDTDVELNHLITLTLTQPETILFVQCRLRECLGFSCFRHRDAPKAVQYWEELALLLWLWFAHGSTDRSSLIIHYQVTPWFFVVSETPAVTELFIKSDDILFSYKDQYIFICLEYASLHLRYICIFFFFFPAQWLFVLHPLSSVHHQRQWGQDTNKIVVSKYKNHCFPVFFPCMPLITFSCTTSAAISSYVSSHWLCWSATSFSTRRSTCSRLWRRQRPQRSYRLPTPPQPARSFCPPSDGSMWRTSRDFYGRIYENCVRFRAKVNLF